MPDYGTWVRRQPLLALPGTPVWTTVQTQAGEGLRRQFAALTPGQAPPTVVGPEQIRLLVYTAISSGSRGLLFLSDSSLEAPDGETRQRVMTLQLLNLELEVIEPWAAGGSMVATAECSQPLVSGAILRDDRAQDRHAHVAGPRLAMRGPAGRGQSAEPHPAGRSRIEQYLRTHRRTLATAAPSPRGGRHPGHAR